MYIQYLTVSLYIVSEVYCTSIVLYTSVLSIALLKLVGGVDRWMDEWMDEWTDGWIDEMDGWMD